MEGQVSEPALTGFIDYLALL